MTNNNTIVVTRHKSLIEFLKQRGIISDNIEIYEHVTPDIVKGKKVVGVLPLYLASLADEVIEVALNIPREKRGQELTLEEIEQYFQGIYRYRVFRECIDVE